MKRLVKRAPSKDFTSDYEPSIGLIEQIAKDTREPYNTEHPGLSANDVLLRLLKGETVKTLNPFGTEVEWTLEDMDECAADRETDLRYSVEEQVDGTHAIFCNGGFVKGDYPANERSAALSDARDMAEAAEQAGVPVMARAE